MGPPAASVGDPRDLLDVHVEQLAGAVAAMRRIQLYVDEDLDDELNVEAARTGRSRSELVREAVRRWLEARSGADAPDSLDAAVGWLDIEPVDDIDAAIYDE